MPEGWRQIACLHPHDQTDTSFAASEGGSVVPGRSFAAAAMYSAPAAANERSPTDQAGPAPVMATDLCVKCIDKARAKRGSLTVRSNMV